MYEEKLTELEHLYKKFENFDGYILNRESFNEFYKSGNRLIYEREYFSRRGCMVSRAMNCLIKNDAVGDAKLLEIIDAVCSEFTWSLPAHVSRDTKNPKKEIDLFSAETAQTLSEIAHYIKLSEKMHKKIRNLLFNRIIEPYENNEFWWETSKHNWAAVCAGCVGMTYLYEFPERIEAVMHRILKTMDCFLSGYGDDGACLEGLGYWEYGFGYFIYFAELLRRKNGIDLINTEKVRKIAEFQHNMFLKNGVSVSFSDASRSGSYNVGLTHFLRQEFGGCIKIPDKKYRRDFDECYRWAGFLRSFLWLDENLDGKNENDFGEKYFENAQWYINKKKDFAFAAKGGNNNEPHNHNDVGSFIIADSERQLIMDFGAGEYTRNYFNDEHRYEYFCTSSEGHNLPVIDGKYQKSGSKYKAEIIKAENDEFILDISRAYNIEELMVFNRSFKITDNKIIMHDSYVFSDLSHEIVERLVSPTEPKLFNGDIKIGSLIIKSKIKPCIKKYTVKNHLGADEAVYTINYKLEDNEFECEFIVSGFL